MYPGQNLGLRIQIKDQIYKRYLYICKGFLAHAIVSTVKVIFRGGSKTVATSKIEHFVIIVNGFRPLTIITKSSLLDVAEVLEPTLI